MHVAFFNRSFYPDTAATGQLLTELCEDLVRDHGCRVSVVAGMPLLPPPTLAATAGASRRIVSREKIRASRFFGHGAHDSPSGGSADAPPTT